MKPLSILVLYSNTDSNSTLSYQHGWPAAFRKHSGMRCTYLNVTSTTILSRIKMKSIDTSHFDAIVMLHSILSNDCMLRGAMYEKVARATTLKALFIGNEYKLMPQKMRHCEELGVGLLISQSESRSIHDLYASRLQCRVAGIPNTGFDPDLIPPSRPYEERSVDIGYRAFDSPWYLGHNERREIADFFLRNDFGLTLDISLDPEKRLAGIGWLGFLNNCRAQIGTEAGGDYFELSDRTRLGVNDYLLQNPNIPFEAVKRRFFEPYRDNIPLRIASGRNVEAAACRTAQILFSGEYGGYFKPDEHYIELKKDFSNMDEVLRKFRDRTFMNRIVQNAFEMVQLNFTYDVLLDRLHRELAKVLNPVAA